jgi:predicted PurR-regulated permease PerM
MLKATRDLRVESSRSAGATRSTSRLELAAQILAVLALLAVLKLHLLASLLAGLLVYQLVHMMTPGLNRMFGQQRGGKVIALAVVAAIVVAAIAGALLGAVALLSGGSESVEALLRKLAEVVDTARSHLPAWALSWIPADPDEMKRVGSEWLREHAAQLRSIGRDVWLVLVHVLIGMIIGGMVAVSREFRPAENGPFVLALTERMRLLGSAFRSVVFAQVRISALNTLLTAVYLLAVVPWIGDMLPLTKTMIAVTFAVGLLPVIGNLISNTVIVMISLSASPLLAIYSLVFLVVIHKLEYFVNARVMGAHINAKAWELLVAMVVMEAAFGVAGVVAAPIFYAYLKNELAAKGLI